MSPQVNLRLTPRLLEKLDRAAARYHLTRSEWMRATLAQAAEQEQASPDQLMVKAFAAGKLTEAELTELVGPEEAAELVLARRLLQEGRDIAAQLVADGAL